MNLKTVKLGSTKWLDALPGTGDKSGHAIRDTELEAEIHKLTQNLGIGWVYDWRAGILFRSITEVKS